MAATGVLKRKFWRACLTRDAGQQLELDPRVRRLRGVHVIGDDPRPGARTQDEQAVVDRFYVQEAIGASAEQLAFLHGGAVQRHPFGDLGAAGHENDLARLRRKGGRPERCQCKKANQK
jgi:hypothetical protein